MLNGLMAMWPLLVLIAVLGVVAVVLEQLKRARTGGPGAARGRREVEEAVGEDEAREERAVTFPYVRKGALMSSAELAFFRVLVAAAGPGRAVMAQVAVSALVEVDVPTGDRGEIQTARNRIDRRVVDFVVCEAGTMRVLGAVELDDRTHGRADRVKRDAFVESALKAAGLPLVRVRCAGSYEVGEIKRRLQEAGLPLPEGGGRGVGSQGPGGSRDHRAQ